MTNITNISIIQYYIGKTTGDLLRGKWITNWYKVNIRPYNEFITVCERLGRVRVNNEFQHS